MVLLRHVFRYWGVGHADGKAHGLASDQFAIHVISSSDHVHIGHFHLALVFSLPDSDRELVCTKLVLGK